MWLGSKSGSYCMDGNCIAASSLPSLLLVVVEEGRKSLIIPKKRIDNNSLLPPLNCSFDGVCNTTTITVDKHRTGKLSMDYLSTNNLITTTTYNTNTILRRRWQIPSCPSNTSISAVHTSQTLFFKCYISCWWWSHVSTRTNASIMIGDNDGSDVSW